MATRIKLEKAVEHIKAAGKIIEDERNNYIRKTGKEKSQIVKDLDDVTDDCYDLAADIDELVQEVKAATAFLSDDEEKDK